MKKLPTLHILNGDATLPAFEAAKFTGQVLVWREILSEGPAVASIPKEAFWLRRQKFIVDAYGEAATAYKAKVLDELLKLEAAGSFFEVVLWFDADLMCQINLLYLLHHIQQLNDTSVYVCIPPLPENIALLSADALHLLFENRQKQTTQQLKQAHEVWQLYAGTDPMALQSYLQQHQHTVQPPLKDALALHLSRFPNCNDGLSQPEKLLLQLVQKGATGKGQLMQHFWKQHPGYGFGDSQLLLILERMQPDLVLDASPLEITSLGKQVLQENAYVTLKEQWLGGYKIDENNRLCYNAITKHLQIFP